MKRDKTDGKPLGFFNDEMNYRFCFVGESPGSRMRERQRNVLRGEKECPVLWVVAGIGCVSVTLV